MRLPAPCLFAVPPVLHRRVAGPVIALPALQHLGGGRGGLARYRSGDGRSNGTGGAERGRGHRAPVRCREQPPSTADSQAVAVKLLRLASRRRAFGRGRACEEDEPHRLGWGGAKKWLLSLWTCMFGLCVLMRIVFGVCVRWDRLGRKPCREGVCCLCRGVNLLVDAIAELARKHQPVVRVACESSGQFRRLALVPVSRRSGPSLLLWHYGGYVENRCRLQVTMFCGMDAGECGRQHSTRRLQDVLIIP